MRFKASCIAATVNDGHRNHCVIIHHTCEGLDASAVWGPEIDNSIYIDDIFFSYEQPPNKEGAWVWEGEVRPLEDDQTDFFGKWRPATMADLSVLIPA